MNKLYLLFFFLCCSVIHLSYNYIPFFSLTWQTDDIFKSENQDVPIHYLQSKALVITGKSPVFFQLDPNKFEYNTLYGDDTQLFYKYFSSKKHYFKEFVRYYRFVQKEIMVGGLPLRRMCYKPNHAGFGNKFFGLMSTLLLAMMSKRLFCICDWPAAPYYVTFPTSVPLIQSQHLRSATFYRFGPKCPGFPLLSNFSLSYMFPNDDIIIESNCKLIPDLNLNSHLTPYYKLMGLINNYKDMDDFTLFVHHQLLRYFVFPSHSLRKYYENIWSTFPKTNYIGLQFRTGNETDFFVYTKKSFLNSTIYSSMMEETLNLTSQYKESVRWFVVSDSSRLKKRIHNQYPNYVVFYNSVIAHTGRAANINYSKESYDALSEIYLLSKCDHIITTPESTFGDLAKAIKG